MPVMAVSITKKILEWIMIMVRKSRKTDLPKIALLSKEFEQEFCCNGVVCDDEKFFQDKSVFVAEENNEIIGYGYGVFEIKKHSSPFYNVEEKCFYIEEMYVSKNFRNNGVGGKLFAELEKYAKENKADFIELSATSKDYKKLLSFYIEKLNLTFWSAQLYKRLK